MYSEIRSFTWHVIFQRLSPTGELIGSDIEVGSGRAAAIVWTGMRWGVAIAGTPVVLQEIEPDGTLADRFEVEVLTRPTWIRLVHSPSDGYAVLITEDVTDRPHQVLVIGDGTRPGPPVPLHRDENLRSAALAVDPDGGFMAVYWEWPEPGLLMQHVEPDGSFITAPIVLREMGPSQQAHDLTLAHDGEEWWVGYSYQEGSAAPFMFSTRVLRGTSVLDAFPATRQLMTHLWLDVADGRVVLSGILPSGVFARRYAASGGVLAPLDESTTVATPAELEQAVVLHAGRNLLAIWSYDDPTTGGVDVFVRVGEVRPCEP